MKTDDIVYYRDKVFDCIVEARITVINDDFTVDIEYDIIEKKKFMPSTIGQFSNGSGYFNMILVKNHVEKAVKISDIRLKKL